MTRIVAVELRRFVWRRSFRLFGAIAFAGIAVAAVIVFLQSYPNSRGADEPAYRAALQECISFHEGEGAQFIPQEYESAEEFCSAQVPLREFDRTFRLTSLEDIFKGTSVPLIILGLALGASFIGAEWHSGTITTLLTWEPRRIRVMGGKVIAAVTAVFLSAVTLQSILGLALWPVAAMQGSTA
jgi:ABC-2 type transport system permease protein